MRYQRALVFSTFLLASLISSCSPHTPGGLSVFESHNHIPLKKCATPGSESGALCGSYEVFEDRAKKTGRKIPLNIVVFPAKSANPSPDPVFVLAGGPGGAATGGSGSRPHNPLEQIGKDRDVILVDQRGTGKSNPLNCDFGEDPSDLASFFGELFPVNSVRSCRERLEKVANLALYTTPIAMDDLDEVREALGYDKINLDGGSYGTFAAQIYMRQHPQHVRAAFLYGVATPDIRQPLLFARASQNALDLLFRDCAADAQCQAAFPNFRNEFDSVIARFDKGPVNAEAIDLTTGQKRTVRITRESFVEHLRLMLYSTWSGRYIPDLIHRAFQNDYVPFESLSVSTNVGLSISRGMYMTVTCSEGVPFITEQMIAEETKGTFLGDARIRAHMRACAEWVRGEIPSNYTDLVNSDAPVILLSGEVDGATPPWFAEDALKHLPNGRQVKIRYMGHEFNNACVWGLLDEFMRTGSSAGLDTRCTAAVRRPAFSVVDPPPPSLH
jgi:pimeloyl-ACP methyl ester carboxylesterase